MDSVEQTVRTYIAENILFSGHTYPYSDDTSFLSEGVLDSMNVLQLVTYVEKQFSLTIEDEEIVPDNFDSVTRLAGYIRNKMQSRENAVVVKH